MVNQLLKLSLFIFIAFIFGWLASARFISIGGIYPNLVLIILLSALFSKFTHWEVGLIFLTGLITLGWQPTFGPELITLSILAIILIFSRNILFYGSFSSLILIPIASTFLFYALLSFPFILSNFSIVLLESIINSVGVILLTNATKIIT